MKKIILFAVAIFFTAIFFPSGVFAQQELIVRVGLVGSLANRDSIAVANTDIFVGYSVTEGFMPMTELHSANGFTVRANGAGIDIIGGGQTYFFGAETVTQVMASDSEFVSIGRKNYRGVMEFMPSGGRVSAINVMSIEEYLFGVLTAEMSPSFHIEALKAQAVTARTYTYNQIRASSHANFDLCDVVCCQVYNGAEREHENTTLAVLETYGLMIFYDGAPILATYFSSSGGATENSEDVWWEALPYLRSVNEIVEHNPMVWERTYTWAQLTSAASNAGARIGTVNGVSVSRLGLSNRVLELTLHGTNGNWVVPRSVGIRGFFSSIGGSLPSRNFTIAGAHHSTPNVSVSDGFTGISAPLNSLSVINGDGGFYSLNSAEIFDGENFRALISTPNIARGGSGITLSGRGWGHGVGMSQMGAEGMARAGYTYDEILRHYYTGVELHWYES
ncbi:MAG: SpoIID/LytB domain-containing protein [Clostridiales bacterium]|jgi:stage II sporulation protein D|nr:SpoIID/LytB domain-containing protein [Clostridiales bacterium]